MSDMPKGMIRREGGGYSLRRRIPLKLVAVYGGRTEIVRALGTKDFSEAKRLLARRTVELDDEFEERLAALVEDPNARIIAKLKQIKDARTLRPSPHAID